MDVREPNKKRLRRVADELEKMVRVDIVNELGNRGLEGAVYGILRHLILAEIWEVISHSPPLRQWMHRRGMWQKLAEDRISPDLLKRVREELSLELIKGRGINYLWILLAVNSQIFDTKEGTVMRKWKNRHGEWSVQLSQIVSSEDVIHLFERAFPTGHVIFAIVLEKTDINGKRATLGVLEIRPDNYDRNDRYIDNDDEASFIAFWYYILASGGTAMVQVFEEGVYGLSQETVLDTVFFEAAYQQMETGEFEPPIMLPEGQETYKMIRAECIHY